MEDETTIDLRQIFTIIRKYLLVILAVPIIATLTAGVAVFFVLEPVYQAETSLLVINQLPGQARGQILHTDILTNRQLVRTYREIARSRVVAAEVIRELNLDVSADRLREMVDVTLRGDTEIFAISVENTDPFFAARLANAVADAFKASAVRIMQVENVTVVDTAVVPDVPIRPRKLLTMVVAGFMGGMAGLGIAFVLSYLDNTFKTPEDVQQHLGLPVLGSIPVFKPQDFTQAQAGV